jgi:hypothetical protein
VPEPLVRSQLKSVNVVPGEADVEKRYEWQAGKIDVELHAPVSLLLDRD